MRELNNAENYGGNVTQFIALLTTFIIKQIKEQCYAFNNPRRRQWHPALSADHGHLKAAVANLRQAHGLLPVKHPDARGNPRYLNHLDPIRPPELRASAGRRLGLRRAPLV